MIKQFETVVIFTPVLSDKDVQSSISTYKKLLTDQGAEIIAEDFWGLRTLAYPIQKKTTGIYYLIEYKAEGDAVANLEVNFNRDHNILRFLTVGLDKYAIKYNDDKRNGLIGRKKNKPEKDQTDSGESSEATEKKAEETASAE